MTAEELNWNSLEKLIVDRLCSDDEVSAYFLYTNLGFSPISISESIQKLTDAGLVSKSGDKIERAERFFDRLLVLRHQIYNRKMPWKQVLD